MQIALQRFQYCDRDNVKHCLTMFSSGDGISWARILVAHRCSDARLIENSPLEGIDTLTIVLLETRIFVEISGLTLLVLCRVRNVDFPIPVSPRTLFRLYGIFMKTDSTVNVLQLNYSYQDVSLSLCDRILCQSREKDFKCRWTDTNTTKFNFEIKY